jgi:glycosyltransferase involved in cell wall biosynthesis
MRGDSGMSGKGARIVISAIQQAVDGACGCSNLAYEEAKYLAAAGNEVWLVAPVISPNAPACERRDGVNLLRYSVPQFQALNPRRAWAHHNGAREVLGRFVRGPVDVLHGHVPLSYQAACDLYGGQAKTCYTVHSPVTKEMEIEWPKKGVGGWFRHGVGLPWLNHIERGCLVRSQRVTALSEFTKDLLIQVHGERLARKVTIVPGWVDLNRFTIVADRQAAKLQLGWPTDRPVLFTLRRLVPRVGIDRLLQATRKLLARGLDFHLMIGGAGPLRSSLEKLGRDLGLTHRVRFLGYVPDSNLPLMYAACDAFVVPSAALECFGLIVIEALACGRPVLASPVAAIPEVLNRFEPRWIARSASEDAIAELLAEFLLRKLPIHSPEELRAVVARYYDSGSAISRFTQLLLN